MLQDGYMDAGGVQNLYFEADLAFDAIKKMRAGEKVEQAMIDKR